MLAIIYKPLETGALTDGRFTVGITKLDQILVKRHEISEDEVRQITIDGIQDVTGRTVSTDTVIPLCSEWALAGSSLAGCFKGDTPQKQIQSRVEKALTILEANHFMLNEAFGQGEDVKESLRSRFDPSRLVQMLEDISGVASLKERYLWCVFT